MKRDDYCKYANQSGSVGNNKPSHAPRVGSETTNVEYNDPKSSLIPTNYRNI